MIRLIYIIGVALLLQSCEKSNKQIRQEMITMAANHMVCEGIVAWASPLSEVTFSIHPIISFQYFNSKQFATFCESRNYTIIDDLGGEFATNDFKFLSSVTDDFKKVKIFDYVDLMLKMDRKKVLNGMIAGNNEYYFMFSYPVRTDNGKYILRARYLCGRKCANNFIFEFEIKNGTIIISDFELMGIS